MQARVASGEDVFGPLLRKYLLNNTHRVTVELLPDAKLGAEQEQAEKDKLKAYQVRSFCCRVGRAIRRTIDRCVGWAPGVHGCDAVFVPPIKHLKSLINWGPISREHCVCWFLRQEVVHGWCGKPGAGSKLGISQTQRYCWMS